MNRIVHKCCAWSGAMCLVAMLVGFVLIAGFIPTRSPGENASEVAQFIIGHRTRIRWGLIVCMLSSSLLMMYAASMAIHMRRIEGRHPALALIQFGMGALFVLEFIYLIFFWQTATFRVDRSPELIQLLNDMAWIPFVGLTSTAVVQVACFGIAVLLDTGEHPIFPRWLGYYNLWVALMFTPGTFNVFFHSGPLAWNGILAWYIPLAVFATWLVINPIYLSRAVDTMAVDVATPARVAGNASASTELSQLRADVDQLLAQSRQ
ncbi:hypothetical protein [Mycobacterium vicinigordonae]|uniref:DUF4386 domain-containing protein n=1 Tax=Mycobacterium vicinigordonae TaxID=1719132 RepID=A0A7D6DXM7_9MYCO|nr:hypothetical protein [Mycobacterium vicinigordonae]QLL06230.1 hypothetical protein H0P51_21045 [Mycobacterium vicinigordonae]